MHTERKRQIRNNIVGQADQATDNTQATSQFSEELKTAVLCFTNLVFTETEVCFQKQSLTQPKTSPIHVKMLVDIETSEIELSCT